MLQVHSMKSYDSFRSYSKNLILLIEISVLACGCFGSAVTSWWCKCSQNEWKGYLRCGGLLSSSERFLVVICVIISAKRTVNSSLNLIWFWCWIFDGSAASQHCPDSFSLPCRTQSTVVSWYLHWRKLKSTAIYFFAWEEFQRKSNIPKLNFARMFFKLNITMKFCNITLNLPYKTCI